MAVPDLTVIRVPPTPPLKPPTQPPKRFFGVFFAGRGSTLQADFLFAGDFAGRRLAHNFAGRGFERPAKKKGMLEKVPSRSNKFRPTCTTICT